MARKSKIDWSGTADCSAKYEAARAKAQSLANADGFDRGIERNDLFREFSIRILPSRENRYGSELACEVVSCENLDMTQSGHGWRK